MIIETSWDDGTRQDLKIAKLLEKYNLTGTFYIPTSCELTPHEIKKLSTKHTIGGHTISHPKDMKLLSDEDQWIEIYNNKKWLEKIIGKKITKFCYPSGRFNDKTVELVKKAGYKEARTTKILNTKKPKDKFRIEATIHAYPFRTEYNKRAWLWHARNNFVEAKANNGYFHLWGHSWEVTKWEQWKKLEELLKYISDNKDN